jgi:fructuronate reductase
MSTNPASDPMHASRLEGAARLALASLGTVAGFETLTEALENKELKTLVTDMLVREIMPVLDIEEQDRAGMADEILSRLAGLEGPLSTHAANGSEQLAATLLDTIRDRIKLGEPSIRLCLGVAGWIKFAGGMNDAGKEYEYTDPMADRLVYLSVQARTNPDALATGFLAIESIFGDDLPNAVLFRQQVVAHLAHLLHQGVLTTVQMVVNGPDMAA